MEILLVNPRHSMQMSKQETAFYRNQFRPYLRYMDKDDFKFAEGEAPVHVGLLSISATLEKEGHHVRYFNVDFNSNQDTQRVLGINSDIIGSTCFTGNFLDTTAFLRQYKVRHPTTRVIVGGPHVSIMDYSALIGTHIDIVVRGEGEKPVVRISKNESLDQILGISFRRNGSIQRTRDAPLNSDLDSLPLPAYHLLPADYKSRVWHVQTSKGCPYDCSFCCEGTLNGKKVRYKSASKVLEEVVLLQDRFKAENIFFIDDTFTLQKDHAYKVCREMKKNSSVSWDCETRVDRLDANMLRTLKEARCRMLYFGVESGSQKILDKNRKGIKVVDIIERCKQAKAMGFKITINMIVGLPGESHESAFESLKFVRMLLQDELVDVVSPYIFTPYPGTDIYNNPADYGIKIIGQKDNWSRYREDSLPITHTGYLSPVEVYNTWARMCREIVHLQRSLPLF